MTKNNPKSVGDIKVTAEDAANVAHSNSQVKNRADIINAMDPPAIGRPGDKPTNTNNE